MGGEFVIAVYIGMHLAHDEFVFGRLGATRDTRAWY